VKIYACLPREVVVRVVSILGNLIGPIQRQRELFGGSIALDPPDHPHVHGRGHEPALNLFKE